MDDTAGIHVENVSYAYGETASLDNVSLAVEPSHFTPLVGLGGAGKLSCRKFHLPLSRWAARRFEFLVFR